MDSSRNKPEKKPDWTTQVLEYFGSHSLREDKKEHLRKTLLAASFSKNLNNFRQLPQRTTKSALTSSMISAAIAATLTFLIVNPPFDEPLDPIAELTQLPGPRVYPPDFDLEGDSKAMNDIVVELFDDKNFFISDLPQQVLADYKPNEGRFFSWDGEPAVSIQMNQKPNAVSKKNVSPATLLIVKLSEKSQRKFPKEKQTRKVAGKAGKVRKVKVWREGNFGYAMVQDNIALNDTP
jgi:hypothetical protein